MRVLKLLLHYNRDDLTRAALNNIPDCLVIDAASEHPFEHHNVIYLDENVGFTRHWNEVLQVLPLDEYDAVALLTNDIVLTQEALQAAIDRLEQIPRIGVIHVSCNSPHKAMEQQEGKDYTIVPFVEMVAPIFRTEVLQQLLPFDEQMMHGWGLDFDLGYQVRRLGYSCAVEHTHSMIHLGHKAYEDNLSTYKQKAGAEMNTRLTEKYGTNWRRDLFHMIGLTMVVCNEAHRLEEMIAYHRGIVDEICIFVQESTDNSEELARQLADRVLTGPCIGYCEPSRLPISLACNSWWQICLDADEYLTDDIIRDLREITHTGAGGYRLARRLILDDKNVWEGDQHYRLFQRDAVAFLSEIHTEPQPRKSALTLPYISIDHRKSLREQVQDEKRYEQIITKEYKNHPTRDAKLKLNVHLEMIRNGTLEDPT